MAPSAQNKGLPVGMMHPDSKRHLLLALPRSPVQDGDVAKPQLTL